jgi:ATP synthase protein I
MSDERKAGGGAPEGKNTPEETELSARLRHIDARLSEIRSDRDASQTPGGRLMADGTAMARGMKLVSEFVAGIVAGGVLGWLADQLLGYPPFGLLIGLMFGFAAGLRNLYRATQGQAGGS